MSAARSRPLAGLRLLARALTAGTALVTLMACYGMIARPGGPMADCMDQDGDGVCAPQDCDDANPAIYPGAADLDGDGIDQSCDGVDGWRDPNQVAAPEPEGAEVAVPAEPAPGADEAPAQVAVPPGGP